ncbi:MULTISPECIES: sensor histidine kinase [Spirulina sp. CCY15215]|uniref:sensor histidine kinase n=1 Tax=Spirulina sp. CCY15215 TaxID=2767591 RepID=UPI00194F9249|nr:sensor histidine kinase [Spirulina major]
MLKNELWRDRSFRLLLYLEWILLGIALIATLSPQNLPPPHRLGWQTPPPLRSQPFPIGAIGCIGLLGLLGLRLPTGGRLQKILYVALGFGLCWLAIFLGGRRESLFFALLLIVVIRACILFPWPGRLTVALCAYGFFILRLILRIYWVVQRHNAIRPGEIASEWLRIAFSFAINSALLFGLVLAFVLLMVGALLSERQSRQALTSANDRLRKYSLLIENQATLQERTRIAREMHDSVGHSLTAQSIQLENAALYFAQNPEKARYHLTEAQRLNKEALTDVRQSVASLRNPPLQGRSLDLALKKLIREFQQTTQIEVISQCRGLVSKPSKPLHPEIQTVLYRVVQEALTNITKHSQADRVELEISSSAIAIDLEIKDNGTGFEPCENTTGFGLQGMQERVEALGGRFSLHSQPGLGCQICINIPAIG